MKKSAYAWFRWAVPTALILLGICFYKAIHGHSFLGLICFCMATVVIAYYILALLKDRYPKITKWSRRILTAGLLVGLLIFAVTEVIIIRASLGEKNQSCEYVVVLGAKVNGTQPSVSLNDRIKKAYAYLTANPEVIGVLTGGKGPDEGICEAQCIYRELTAMGIDPQRLWLEEKATSTWENLKFSLDIIEEKTGTRPTSVGLLSSEYHLFRAGLFAKDCGVEAIGIPAKTSWISMKINYFAREVAGVWHYFILGGQYHD